MNYVNTDAIGEIVNDFKLLSEEMKEKFQEIENNCTTIKEKLEEVQQFEGTGVKEPYSTTEETNTKNTFCLHTYQEKRHINVTEWKFNQSELKSLITNQETFEEKISDLNNLNEVLIESISMIESQLRGTDSEITYNGNYKDFLDNLKKTSYWQELEKNYQTSRNLKNKEEIYQKFRTKNGKKDYVDYALDELGTKFFNSTYSSKYATWYSKKYQGQGASPSDDWCAEFVSYIMDKSNNASIVAPYLATSTGAAAVSSSGKNTLWHTSEEVNNNTYQPQRGDIFYNYKGHAQHTGIVIGSDKNYIYTIEGNTANNKGKYYVKDGTSNNKGGYVNIRVRPKSYVEGGYYSPECYINEELKKNSTNIQVSSDTMNTKLAIDEKYQQLKEVGGHEQKSTMG
ncbi:MAG: CHAP domain-containing protein [Bacilli bacterium]|nr:CHAP domain-containing protein [Bacilli bacterium]